MNAEEKAIRAFEEAGNERKAKIAKTWLEHDACGHLSGPLAFLICERGHRYGA